LLSRVTEVTVPIGGQGMAKRCGSCGAVHTAEGWRALELQSDGSDPAGVFAGLELRTCSGCGTTLAIEIAPETVRSIALAVAS
jgi:hypothetical protein